LPDDLSAFDAILATPEGAWVRAYQSADEALVFLSNDGTASGIPIHGSSALTPIGQVGNLLWVIFGTGESSVGLFDPAVGRVIISVPVASHNDLGGSAAGTAAWVFDRKAGQVAVVGEE
jgi:hypothetical protein